MYTPVDPKEKALMEEIAKAYDACDFRAPAVAPSVAPASPQPCHTSQDPALVQRAESLSAQYGRPFWARKNGEILDSLAWDPEFAAKAEQAEAEARRILRQRGRDPRAFGSCHGIWSLKKQILLEDYGISWLTPAELNPHIRYD